ncbi:aconitate hydratase AcnA [Spirochaeta thermophila]|uniref:Aconitate hydratase n=1 Tax=Winmispira thermophila (strain ATCC 49972 / DSM 6192 / RI 19.B1) TaxID=665571 RepID=E0RQV0_WINT6|nr:aconitate hydratase AcnA [Spirochaeta thermophila]ADN03006.1 aconitate hydratase [Spirochaeta thermophila DSM 6192]
MDLVERMLGGRRVRVVDMRGLPVEGGLERMPYSMRVLLENVARGVALGRVEEEMAARVGAWQGYVGTEVAYFPARVLMQDFTGVPAVVDLAVMRDAVAEKGGDPSRVTPQIPVDLVVDHSVQLDFWARRDALERNVEKEYERNGERYRLLKWAGRSMANFRVVPPNSGICHQINVEYLAQVVREEVRDGMVLWYPDSLVGTDSHTTMVNGLGVMGWGVGGIEAEAVMLGEAYVMPLPEVVGVRLVGRMPEGVTATDVVLTLTHLLRKKGVVGKFVEYFGPALSQLSVPDRVTIANMAPEYGATMGFFPVDERTVAFLRMTGREEAAARAEAYLKEVGLWYDPSVEPVYSDVLELDLSTVEPTLAGPYRPQDRLRREEVPVRVGEECRRLGAEGEGREVELGGERVLVPHGAVAIASITSCTNTSNPAVMLGAGLVARRAVERGMRVPRWVKTSLAPGSRVVVDYLARAGVLGALEELGFSVAAFGCATCIGNSGPLPAALERAADEGLLLASVASGNRNFEARIHQKVRFNILASPIYVVLYALAGSVMKDLSREPVGKDREGRDVFLHELLPSPEEIARLVEEVVIGEDFERRYAGIFEGDERWRGLEGGEGILFSWDEASTYIRKPPFFELEGLPERIERARVLGFFGDSVTTDHISPAGAIPPDYPAGRYLQELGVRPEEFNSYGSRRGNHEVMMRGTFANIRLKNRLTPDVPGGYTLLFPERTQSFIYDAAMEYRRRGVPLVVLGGREYGTGSSRDWAAKGTRLLGVRAVLARSFERIHRSNLVGMGVLPLCFPEGKSAEELGLTGEEELTIEIGALTPRKRCLVRAERDGREVARFEAEAQVFSQVEVAYLAAGGLLPYVLGKLGG